MQVNEANGHRLTEGIGSSASNRLHAAWLVRFLRRGLWLDRCSFPLDRENRPEPFRVLWPPSMQRVSVQKSFGLHAPRKRPGHELSVCSLAGNRTLRTQLRFPSRLIRKRRSWLVGPASRSPGWLYGRGRLSERRQVADGRCECPFRLRGTR